MDGFVLFIALLLAIALLAGLYYTTFMTGGHVAQGGRIRQGSNPDGTV